MADNADFANDRAEDERAARIKAIRSKPTPTGRPGECDLCGEWSGRLVQGVCAPCRDKYGMD